MSNTTWKEFGKNTLTHSGAHYLMAIQKIHEEQGYARLSDVAKSLKISKGSLSTSLKPLMRKKLIIEDENKHLFLSEIGQKFAKNIRNTYSVINHLFGKILNVDAEIAEVDACKIEHLLSEESTGELLRMVKALETKPTLLKALKDEMHNYEKCSIKGCRTCSKNTFCLKD
ncbi:metal-dependent transcriptional regulator [Candidatus Peregrinibacteria bacterium]|nr:metal-dependent transcriptional regulator [Candidatus Peregrinibacteria bacterium]